MMQHELDRLSEYLDGELSPRDRAAVERHLAACEECTIALVGLRAVVNGARALENRPPAEDLWAAIEARLEPRVSTEPRKWSWTWPRITFTIPQLAGAAAALVLISAGSMWMALGGRPGQPTDAMNASSGSSRSAAVATFDEGHYGPAIRELEEVLKQHRSELDTSTVQVLEQNLALIDRASEEARRALAADPGNSYLSGHLAAQLKKKIWLLQRATSVVAAQGGGESTG